MRRKRMGVMIERRRVPVPVMFPVPFPFLVTLPVPVPVTLPVRVPAAGRARVFGFVT